MEMSGSGPDKDHDLSYCQNWSNSRFVVEAFVLFALLENIFGCYIIFSTRKERSGGSTPFSNLCVFVVNISCIILCVTVLLFPLSFTWNENNKLNAVIPKSNQSQNKEYLIFENQCGQLYSPFCYLSGFLFSLFSYVPLAATGVMAMDRVCAAFCWKAYKFKKVAVSTVRILVLFGCILSLVAMFLVPMLRMDIHYHFDTFMKVCTLPWSPHEIEEKILLLVVHGFIVLMVILLIINGLIGFFAGSSQKTPKRNRRSRFHHNTKVTVLFGRFVVFQSHAWISFRRVSLGITLVSVLTYLPLAISGIYHINFHKGDDLHKLTWFHMTSNLLGLAIPILLPAIYLFFHEPYRLRFCAICKKIFCLENKCKPPTPKSFWQSDSSPDRPPEWDILPKSRIFPFSLSRLSGKRRHRKIKPLSDKKSHRSRRTTQDQALESSDEQPIKYKDKRRNKSDRKHLKVPSYSNTADTTIESTSAVYDNQVYLQTDYENFISKNVSSYLSPTIEKAMKKKQYHRKHSMQPTDYASSNPEYCHESDDNRRSLPSPEHPHSLPYFDILRNAIAGDPFTPDKNHRRVSMDKEQISVYIPQANLPAKHSHHQLHVYHHHIWPNRIPMEESKQEQSSSFNDTKPKKERSPPVPQQRKKLPKKQYPKKRSFENNMLANTSHHQTSPRRHPDMPMYSNRLEFDVSEEPEEPPILSKYEKIGFKYI